MADKQQRKPQETPASQEDGKRSELERVQEEAAAEREEEGGYQ